MESKEEMFKMANELMNDRLVDSRIQEAKKYFRSLEKSGKNNYQHFQYHEAKDIFPVVQQLCDDLDLVTRFSFNEGYATLVVKCNEDKSIAYYTISTPIIQESNPARYMQEVGKVQTYAMRYLYIQCFEIAVPDEIDGSDTRKKSEKQALPKNNSKKRAPKPSKDMVDSKQTRNIHDLARIISEEMNSKGISDTAENAMEYVRQKRVNGQITPMEYKLLRDKLGGTA